LNTLAGTHTADLATKTTQLSVLFAIDPRRTRNTNFR
jgi:hypothetical protein